MTKKIIQKRTTCRLCDSKNITFEIELPVAAIADHYAVQPNEELPVYPQDLYQCADCGHVQVLDVISREHLFSQDYTYRPSRNPAVVRHFESYAAHLDPYLGHIAEPRVLDIGSNDGLFLETIKRRFGAVVTGIDPAAGAAEEAQRRGIPTICDYWSTDIARKRVASGVAYDLVSANNVFAHNDDLQDFGNAISAVLKDDGIFSAEISYLADIVSKSLIGTFFHEHVSHHSLTSLRPFLRTIGLNLFDAIPVDTQGGALIIFASRRSLKESERLGRLLALEREFDLVGRRSMAALRANLAKMRRDVISLIHITPFERLVMYGASRSLNLIVDFFDLRGQIDLIVDSDDQKVGRYLRESKARIVSASEFKPKRGDLVFCSAWVHTESIRQRLRCDEAQAHFLSIYPTVELV